MLPVLDATALEAEVDELQSEMMMIADLMQKCIYENARIALDQSEYQKHYNELTAGFDSAKATHDKLTSAISDKQVGKAIVGSFIEALKA
ncbi:MAG: hypothetical protein Q4D31_00795 [Eubacteriales bacterium]|nr:hypothetical protein [Eubacteriales bacterium]